MFGGSICLTELIEKANQGHSGFSKAANGKIYFNMTTWLNDEKDQYGNTMSHMLNPTKEKKDFDKAKFGKCYIGNSKPIETQAGQPLTHNDSAALNVTNDIPVRGAAQQTPSYSSASAEEPMDDLPF